MNERIYYSQEAEARATRERNTAILMFFGLGTAIGAIMALLLTPKSGSDVRDELSDRIEQGIEDGRDTSRTAIRRLERELADVRKRLEDALDDVR